MKKTTKTKNKPTLIAILLDRSGSMDDCKQETISGFNAYVGKAKEGGDKTIVFIQQFDSNGIDVLSDCVPISKAVKLDKSNFLPRGMTPLYDAMGNAIKAVKDKSRTHKILFVTMTDGLENASHEWKLDALQKAIKEMEDKEHWTFVYLGVGLQGFQAAQNVARGTSGASNILHTDKTNLVRSYARAGGQTVNYMASIPSAKASIKGFWQDPKKGKNETAQ